MSSRNFLLSRVLKNRGSFQLLLLIFLFSLNCLVYFNRNLLFASYEVGAPISRVLQAQKHNDDFCIFYNVTRGKKDFKEDGKEPVTLAVHGTPSYFADLFQQVKDYDGPISLSLFVDRPVQAAVEFLYNFYLCDKLFADKVTFHVVFRLTAYYKSCPIIDIKTRPCTEMTKEYMSSFIKDLLPPFGIYPINVMRNAARRGAPSHFALISDIEMMYSENFQSRAKKLANEHISKDKKNLIVIRRFEIEENIQGSPRSVKDLKSHIDNKTVFEFHHEHFPQGHTIPGLPYWLGISSANDSVTVWEIPYRGMDWEPQVIMHSSAPFGEEDVPTRWRDQQAQIYELCKADYKFLLASHLFNVHRGVKRISSPLEIAVKSHQGNLRHRSLTKFTKRLGLQYPNSTTKCGGFSMS